MSFNIKERDDDDLVDSGMAEYFDPIPELKACLGDGYQQRAMAAFYIDAAERDYYDSIARAFIKSDESAARGQYCLYYTLFPGSPVIRRAGKLLDGLPSSNRLIRKNCYGSNYRIFSTWKIQNKSKVGNANWLELSHGRGWMVDRQIR